MPTGWRPSDVAKKFPLLTLENPADLKKYTTHNSLPLLGWTFIQLLLTSALMFLIFFNIDHLEQAIVLFLGGLLMMHVMAYTLLLDGNSKTLWLEGGKCILGIGFLLSLNTEAELLSPLAGNLVFFYLLLSLGLTMYFHKSESSPVTTS